MNIWLILAAVVIFYLLAEIFIFRPMDRACVEETEREIDRLLYDGDPRALELIELDLDKILPGAGKGVGPEGKIRVVSVDTEKREIVLEPYQK